MGDETGLGPARRHDGFRQPGQKSALRQFPPGECPLPGEAPEGHLRPLVFHKVHIRDALIVLDGVHVRMEWSEFDDCTFRQHKRPLLGGSWAPQGMFGREPCVFRRCRFVGVQFSPKARFTLGEARFEDCAFERCKMFVFARDVDFVRCRFVGAMVSASFWGRSPRTGLPNEIVGNDFTAAEFRGPMGWKGDFPVEAQLWPENYDAAAERDRSEALEREVSE